MGKKERRGWDVGDGFSTWKRIKEWTVNKSDKQGKEWHRLRGCHGHPTRCWFKRGTMDGFIPNSDGNRMPWQLKLYKYSTRRRRRRKRGAECSTGTIHLVYTRDDRRSSAWACRSLAGILPAHSMPSRAESCHSSGAALDWATGRQTPLSTLSPLSTTHLTWALFGPLECFCGTRSANGLHRQSDRKGQIQYRNQRATQPPTGGVPQHLGSRLISECGHDKNTSSYSSCVLRTRP